MEKRKRGRQITVWTPQFITDILKKLEAYIDESDIPIVAEFAYKNKIRRDELYSHPELDDLLKLLVTKKEANLELGCLTGSVNPAMAIFSLKQLGWTDRQEMDVTQTMQYKFDMIYADGETKDSSQ